MTIKISQKVIVKAPGLLPMLYKPSELAKELCIHRRTLYDWLNKNGAPYTRDAHNHIWINGEDFAQWIAKYKKETHRKLEENEAYCMRCKKIVQLEKPTIIPIKAKLINIRGICPFCQGTIVRGGRKNG